MKTLFTLRYLFFLLLPISFWISLNYRGIYTYFPLVFIFLVLPIVEFFLPQDHSNPSAEEEVRLKNINYFDYLLYSVIPIIYGSLFLFWQSLQVEDLTLGETIGRTLSCGLLLGALGINVAHELGHRQGTFYRSLSFLLLLPCFYSHFLIEHYIGHHARVSTIHDPATGRRGESLYRFLGRSLIFSYLSAWQIQCHRLKKKGYAFFSFKNHLMIYQGIQALYLIGLIYFLGWEMAGWLVAAGFFGCILLETVNYIEHYGLERKFVEEKRYERVQPHHSWNSDHLISRFVLFELSRHSDHHFNAHRPYQILRYHESSPQMPLGYPGMAVLALFPPIWFRIMHKRLAEFEMSQQHRPSQQR